MRSRTVSREIALQLLYEYDTTGELTQERIDHFVSERTSKEDTREYARRLVTGVVERIGEFDGIVEKLAEHWAVSRMPVVDRNILRIGACELLYGGDVPAKVAINEAVELAKRFGSADSGRFINAILDRLHKENTAKDAGGSRKPGGDI